MKKPIRPDHECESECNCQIDKRYLNELDDYRQAGVKAKSKNLVQLGQTSSSKIVRVGKRKFDLPKPRLTRP